jgi:hypothetical protein
MAFEVARQGARRTLAALLLGATAGLSGCAAWLPPPMTAALQQAARTGPPAAELSAVPFFPLTEAAQARHCGPQALASTLVAAGLPGDPLALADATYLPARGGSLQIEMLAAARRSGALAVILPGTLAALFDEIDAGHPVLVLQNLGLAWAPRWHYAVLIGYDQAMREFILRSGNEARQRLPWATFEYTWARAAHWSVVVLPPGRLPASASAAQGVQAALDFERLAAPVDAVRVWRSVLQRWPDQLVAALGLANGLHAQGHDDAAAQVLETATQRHRSAVLWNNLAQVEISRGRWPQAQAALDQAFKRAREAEPRWLAEVDLTAAALAAARTSTEQSAPSR